MNKSTKLTKQNKKNDLQSTESKNNPAQVLALQKVFYISEQLLNSGSELRLERFYHPGKSKPALFITNEKSRHIQEMIEFAEKRRCWLINNNACSNGRVYITTPFDVTFLALHHIRQHCSKKAMALDSIRDDNDASTARLLTTYISPEQLSCVSDARRIGDDLVYFKYNYEKTMAWLALKARSVVQRLKTAGVYCGHSALSHNYARSQTATEECLTDLDYLRVACDLVGNYISLELHEELKLYLDIPSAISTEGREETSGSKRKSVQAIKSIEKKVKLNECEMNNGSDSPEGILDAKRTNTVLKLRNPTTIEKALAKGAKGTKSIASFFKK